MILKGKYLNTVFLISLLTMTFISAAYAQKEKNPNMSGTPVLWESVNVKESDLFLGPGGEEMKPDLSKITLIKRETGGSSKKYRIKDGSGREWVAKIDVESQAEVAAVRLVAALGYKTEINYLAPTLTIPGAGTFSNVSLEARPSDVERAERWKWDKNPFLGTKELQGLKIMMAMVNNWDLKNPGNNKILKKDGELQYVVSDMGASFGKTGKSGMAGPLSPIFWAMSRSKNNPDDYSKSKLIHEIEKDGKIDLAYGGRNKGLLNDIRIEHGRWLADLLLQLSDKQIEDAFRAANYSEEEIKTLVTGVKNKIYELDFFTKQ
jgi:hypothetical protein